jgi:hypothetical protein
MSTLEHPGVRIEYEHAFKRVEPGETVTAGGAVLKWYEIAPASSPVPPAIRELARHSLVDGGLDLAGELGFVILHRCGESFYFLLVSTWRNDNELWETVWAKNGEDDPAFRPWPIEGTHRPTFCVWELGAVWQEQRAWSRYLCSERDDAAKEDYLQASFEAAV